MVFFISCAKKNTFEFYNVLGNIASTPEEYLDNSNYQCVEITRKGPLTSFIPILSTFIPNRAVKTYDTPHNNQAMGRNCFTGFSVISKGIMLFAFIVILT